MLYRISRMPVRATQLPGVVVGARSVCLSLDFSASEPKAAAPLSCHKRLHGCVSASMLGVICLLVGLTFSRCPANRNSSDVLAASFLACCCLSPPSTRSACFSPPSGCVCMGGGGAFKDVMAGWDGNISGNSHFVT